MRRSAERAPPNRQSRCASVDQTEARKTRRATLRAKVRRGCGIATDSPRSWFPCNPVTFANHGSLFIDGGQKRSFPGPPMMRRWEGRPTREDRFWHSEAIR